ncbi:MAG: hypothetical protein ACLFWL_11675 [Candidatus Brocadiia bacterium]
MKRGSLEAAKRQTTEVRCQRRRTARDRLDSDGGGVEEVVKLRILEGAPRIRDATQRQGVIGECALPFIALKGQYMTAQGADG